MANPIADPTDRRTQSRRKHPRALVGWPVTVISSTDSYQGKAANISRGGALIHLSQELTVGDTVRLAFEVPDYQDVIVAKGEILRSFPLKRGDEQEFSHSAALRFTEISDENLKYFSGNIAPEWKEGYKDTYPKNNDIVFPKDNKNTRYLPWILSIILLIPLSYFVYDSIQRKVDEKDLIYEVESRLLILEEQIISLQTSLNLLRPLERQLNDLQTKMSNLSNFANSFAEADSIMMITQKIDSQIQQIKTINQKIKHIEESNLKNTKSDQSIKEEEYYIVQKDDNLFQISTQNKITIQELKEINGIGPNEAIFPGQKLKIK